MFREQDSAFLYSVSRKTIANAKSTNIQYGAVSIDGNNSQ